MGMDVISVSTKNVEMVNYKNFSRYVTSNTSVISVSSKFIFNLWLRVLRYRRSANETIPGAYMYNVLRTYVLGMLLYLSHASN